MFSILFAMALGILPGHLLRGRPALTAFVNRATGWTVHGLLFLLGAALGADAALFAQLPALGLRGVGIGFLCSMGSVLCARYMGRAVLASAAPAGKEPSAREQCEENCGAQALKSALKSSGIILLYFILGLAFGRLGAQFPGQSGGAWSFLFSLLTGGDLTEAVILLLMFSVGMSLGFDLSSFGIMRELRGKVLLVPLAVTAGTFLGSLAAFALLPGIALPETLSVGAGFGYYSLSSAIITQLGNPVLGSTALLANIFRELFSLLAAPLLARFFGPLAPLASAGATSMDTCLPMIVRCSGERCGIIAVFSGMLLTLAVPVLVPALLALSRFLP